MQQPLQSSPVISMRTCLKNMAGMVEKSGCHRLLALAEENMLTWRKVLQNQQELPVRLGPNGLPQNSACSTTSWRKAESLEYYDAENGLQSFPDLLQQKTAAISLALDTFDTTNTLPDSHSCDTLMMHMSSFSRFLAYWVSAAASMHINIPVQEESANNSKDFSPAWGKATPAHRIFNQAKHSQANYKKNQSPANINDDELPQLIWLQYLVWEPSLNQGITAWRQNTLADFLASAQKLRTLAQSPPTPLQEHLPQQGWPFCRKGQSRFLVEEEVIRKSKDCRMRSGFRIALEKLQQAITQCHEQDLLNKVRQEAMHFIYMLNQNRFAHVRQPFFRVPKTYGYPVICRVSNLHPYLIAPNDFYKHAMLCYTNAYQTESGAHHEMYLQIQRLWRTLYCNPAIEPPQDITQLLQQAVMAWDSNNKQVFNRQLFRFSESFVAWCEKLGATPWQHALEGLQQYPKKDQFLLSYHAH